MRQHAAPAAAGASVATFTGTPKTRRYMVGTSWWELLRDTKNSWSGEQPLQQINTRLGKYGQIALSTAMVLLNQRDQTDMITTLVWSILVSRCKVTYLSLLHPINFEENIYSIVPSSLVLYRPIRMSGTLHLSCHWFTTHSHEALRVIIQKEWNTLPAFMSRQI